jgi:hypothetical protein
MNRSSNGSITSFLFFLFTDGQNANDHDDGRFLTSSVVSRDPALSLFFIQQKKKEKEE